MNRTMSTCVACGQPLERGEAEEANTYRTTADGLPPRRYFCRVSEDARHRLECGHAEYDPDEGCAYCEEALGIERPDVQVIVTYPDEEAAQAARISRVDVLPASAGVDLIPGIQVRYRVVATVPEPAEPLHVHPSSMECNVMCPAHPNTVKAENCPACGGKVRYGTCRDCGWHPDPEPGKAIICPEHGPQLGIACPVCVSPPQ